MEQNVAVFPNTVTKGGSILKSNSSKHPLFASVLALTLSLAMLVGTTFAWFTDTASTGVNVIQAGNLDIELYSDADCETPLSAKDSLKFLVATGDKDADPKPTAADQIKWEPGCTYQLQPVWVKNNGTLALRYSLMTDYFNNPNDDKATAASDTASDSTKGNLNDVLTWTVQIDGNDITDAKYIKLAADQKQKLTISVTMDENAGNDYMDKQLTDLDIYVVATQDTVEYDSVSNDYDKQAPYEEPYTSLIDDVKFKLDAEKVSSLEEFLKAFSNGGAVLLTAPVDQLKTQTSLEGASDNDVSLDMDLNENSVIGVASNAKMIYVSNATASFSNGTLEKTGSNSGYNSAILEVRDNSVVTLDNVTARLKGDTGDTIVVGTNSELILNNSTVIGPNKPEKEAALVVGYQNSIVTANDSTIEGAIYVKGTKSQMTINGGDYTKAYFYYTSSRDSVANATSPVVISGGTFSKNPLADDFMQAMVMDSNVEADGKTRAAKIADGYEVKKINDNTWEVVKSASDTTPSADTSTTD
jgi:predicted ribosomally synthesized peptide with SipW-like signal peptide